MIYIIKRYTCAVCYHSEKSGTISEAVKEAYLSGANLSRAYLSGAYLSGANLSRAYLSGANLSRAYLSRAYLIGAILPAGMSIMQILGSRVPLVALSTPEGLEVRSGCEHHDLEWWQANGETLGRKEGYSDSQIDEYKRHFVYLTEWHAFVRSMKG